MNVKACKTNSTELADVSLQEPRDEITAQGKKYNDATMPAVRKTSGQACRKSTNKIANPRSVSKP